MTYATATITSATPAKDLMAALATPLTTAGLTLVETYSSPANSNWTSVTYGGSTFVAVASGTATAATSADGITWTQRALPVSAAWTSVTYGGGVFVAIANGPTTIAASSSDGITWTQRTMPTSADWISVTYGGGLFAAVSTSSTIGATSPDGITWTQRALPAASPWTSVTYGGSMFVAVASGTSNAASSPDGITWTLRTMPVSSVWATVTYGGSVFVAVANSTTIGATSPDGITWTQRVMPISSTWKSVTYGGGLFVAVSAFTTIGASSSDGITWTQRALPTGGAWAAVTYGASTFVALGANQSMGATSPDGITWTQRLLSAVSTNPSADIYKGPAGSNQFGQDWFLVIRRSNDTATTLLYQVAETYNATTHRAGNLGGTAVAVIPTATTYANPAVAAAPDTMSSPSIALTTTAFTYWVSATVNRVVLGVKTATEIGFYAGLYDDLLPSGVTQFPLVCARLPITQTVTAPSVGGAQGSGTGGFTREPGQAASSFTNFEAAIHCGFAPIAGAGTIMAANFSPLPLSTALYGNVGAMSRCIIGSQRSVTNYGDAVRGLLNGVFCSGVSSIAGDTITTGGKTYVRVGGPVTTYGLFVDTAL